MKHSLLAAVAAVSLITVASSAQALSLTGVGGGIFAGTIAGTGSTSHRAGNANSTGSSRSGAVVGAVGAGTGGSLGSGGQVIAVGAAGSQSGSSSTSSNNGRASNVTYGYAGAGALGLAGRF